MYPDADLTGYSAGLIAPPDPHEKINNFHEDDYGALLCVSEV
jgi:hypothetical protein